MCTTTAEHFSVRIRNDHGSGVGLGDECQTGCLDPRELGRPLRPGSGMLGSPGGNESALGVGILVSLISTLE